jgi:hypothetical protein
MPAGVILLGEVAARAATIEIVCRKCDRYGRLRTDRLLAEHGPAMGMPALLRFMAGNCARLDNASITDRCDAHCPDLTRLFLSTTPSNGA